MMMVLLQTTWLALHCSSFQLLNREGASALMCTVQVDLGDPWRWVRQIYRSRGGLGDWETGRLVVIIIMIMIITHLIISNPYSLFVSLYHCIMYHVCESLVCNEASEVSEGTSRLGVGGAFMTTTTTIHLDRERIVMPVYHRLYIIAYIILIPLYCNTVNILLYSVLLYR